MHGALAQLAHRLHVPAAEPLRDAGFALLPELGLARAWVSEALFGALFLAFVAWSFSPFWGGGGAPKSFHTVTLYARAVTTLCLCQALRAASFLATSLPAPNYHCRAGAATATRPWPARAWGHAAVDVARQAGHGCGDLIFSSHTTFALVGALGYAEFGARAAVKAAVWAAVAALSALIVASRKHYTVDVVVAWYVVPLVARAARGRWTSAPRAARDGEPPPGLPVTGGASPEHACPSCGHLAGLAPSGGAASPPRRRGAGPGAGADLASASLEAVRVDRG